jgi:hypothetical protein
MSTSFEVRKWNTRLPRAPIMVVIELVKVVPVHAPTASTVVQGRALVLKCIEILSRKRHKLFEVRISAGTCPKVLHKQHGESIIYGDWLNKTREHQYKY